jgi:hypothetical protein
MTWRTTKRVLLLVLVGALSGYSIYRAGHWFAFNVPIVTFSPVCQVLPTTARYRDLDELRHLPGAPTPEFWIHLRRYFAPDRTPAAWRGVGRADGRLQISLGAHLNLYKDDGKHDSEFEGGRILPMRFATYRILAQRMKEGRFGPEVQKRYMVSDIRAEGGRRLMKSYECPLAEALMIEGGALAGPPRGPSE